jgi:hypothetical protein
MGLGAMIQIGSGFQKLIGETQTHTDGKAISEAYIYFFQNKERRLKIVPTQPEPHIPSTTASLM